MKFRRIQFDGLADILAKYSVDTDAWPPEAVMLFLERLGRFMGEERSYGIDLGHKQANRVIERLIGRLEGGRHARRRRPRR